MIVIEKLPAEAPPRSSVADRVALTWEQRVKTRQRLRSEGGRELVVKLPTGTRLPPGTVLFLGDGFHVEVAAAEEEVWEVRAGDQQTLARIAYEIGNRHFPIHFGHDFVAVLYDHTLAELWQRLGVTALRTRRPFLSEQRPHEPHGH